MRQLTTNDILNHPRFSSARRAHIDALVTFMAGDRLVGRLMRDVTAIFTRAMIVGFHAAYDPDDRSTWATPGQIRAEVVERGLASARRVDDVLARFRQAKLLTSVLPSADNRVRILRPTQQLIAYDRDHLAIYHRVLLALYPGRGYEWTLREDGDVHLAFRRASFHTMRPTRTFTRDEPMMLFLSRDGGYLALLLVAQSELSPDGPPLSYTSVAAQAGVSRTHIRNLFGEAEARSYVQLGDRRRPIRLLPALWEAYDRFLADMAADQDAAARWVFADPDDPAG